MAKNEKDETIINLFYNMQLAINTISTAMQQTSVSTKENYLRRLHADDGPIKNIDALIAILKKQK